MILGAGSLSRTRAGAWPRVPRCRTGWRPPPSLANIYKELESDLGLPRPATGDLTKWAHQGVLLLNNTLTVEAGQAGSPCRARVGCDHRCLCRGGRRAGRADRVHPVGQPMRARRQGASPPFAMARRIWFLTSAHPSPLSAP